MKIYFYHWIESAPTVSARLCRYGTCVNRSFRARGCLRPGFAGPVGRQLFRRFRIRVLPAQRWHFGVFSTKIFKFNLTLICIKVTTYMGLSPLTHWAAVRTCRLLTKTPPQTPLKSPVCSLPMSSSVIQGHAPVHTTKRQVNVASI